MTPYDLMRAERNRLQAKIDQMEIEIRLLRGEQAIHVEEVRVIRVCTQLSVSPQQAWILCALHQARGRPVNRWWLSDNLPRLDHAGREDPANGIRVRISQLRKKIGPNRIGTLKGFYYLTETGMATMATVRP